MSRNEALSGIVATSSFDYLDSTINRPDMFEETNTAKGSILKTPPHPQNLVATIMTIILSGFIFVTIVGWFSLLQAYYDSLFINEIITALVKSRLYYAITVTLITIVVFGSFLYFYIYYFHKK